MPSVNPYTSSEVCELTGLTQRQLDYGCRCGMFGSKFQRRMGSGSRREFTDADLAGVESVAKAIRHERALRAAIDDGTIFAEGYADYIEANQEVTNG